MKDNLKANISKAFAAPAPQKKQEFLKKMKPAKIHTFDILRTQASYVRAVSWILPMMILPVVFIGVHQNWENVIHLTEAITPFLAAIGILETWRSYTYRMMELEQATRFSLRTVVYARMLLTGCAGSAMILLSSAILANHFQISFLLMTARIGIPYLLTMSLGLQIERTTFGRNNPFCSVAIAVIIAALVIWAEAASISFEAALSGEFVIALAVGLLAFTTWEAIKTIQYTETYA